MIDWFVKRVICGKVNDLLKDYKNDVEKLRPILSKCIERMKKVLTCFESLLAKIEDNELDATEVQQTKEEITKLIKEW
jgi:hypothetical protein